MQISCGNSFNLAEGNRFAVGNMPVEGALALAPGLHVFDTSGFQRIGNAL